MMVIKIIQLDFIAFTHNYYGFGRILRKPLPASRGPVGHPRKLGQSKPQLSSHASTMVSVYFLTRFE